MTDGVARTAAKRKEPAHPGAKAEAQFEKTLAEISARMLDAGSLEEGLAVAAALDAVQRSRVSEARYRSLLQTQAQIIARSDTSGRLTYVNDAYCRAFGKTAEELIGFVFTPTVVPEDLSITLAALEAIKKPPYRLETETRHFTPSGVRWFFWDNSAVLDENGNILEFQGVGLDITDRKLAELALRESEERLRLAIHAGKMYVFEWNPATDFVTRSPEAEEVLGVPGNMALCGEHFLRLVHPEDRQNYFFKTLGFTPENPTYSASYRLVRPNGVTIWLQEAGEGFFDERKCLTKVVGMVTDITAQKEAEKAIADLSGRLINTQEEERHRIARELHDGVGQSLAVISVQLGALLKNPSDPKMMDKLSVLYERVKSVGKDISYLSHQLHPSGLNRLGLAPALKALCREMQEAHQIVVEFTESMGAFSPPRDVSLCLFRIAQEALQNAVKHSKSKRAWVELQQEHEEITMSIRDEGCGFDLSASSAGLGLVSMRERARLVGGTIEIESTPGGGTQIQVRVPAMSKPAA